MWFLFIFIIQLKIVFTRVSLGGHYPSDVIIGSILAYITAL
ncbi:phosphatase PAP2 family protein [Arenibacter sp. N53]|nr:phosphatase PAP2 family protein [Arenibacter sp. N53]